MSTLIKQLRDYINFVDDIELRRFAANQLEQLEAKVVTQQARIEQLLNFIKHAEVSSGVCCCGDSINGHPSPMACGHSPVDMWDHAVGKLLDAPSDLSALRAHDAAIWREAMQIAEDSCDKATMSKYSSVPECRAARDMAECLSKAYCHKADAIEKGGE